MPCGAAHPAREISFRRDRARDSLSLSSPQRRRGKKVESRGNGMIDLGRSGRKGDIVRKCRGSNPLFAFSNSPLARSVCQ